MRSRPKCQGSAPTPQKGSVQGCISDRPPSPRWYPRLPEIGTGARTSQYPSYTEPELGYAADQGNNLPVFFGPALCVLSLALLCTYPNTHPNPLQKPLVVRASDLVCLCSVILAYLFFNFKKAMNKKNLSNNNKIQRDLPKDLRPCHLEPLDLGRQHRQLVVPEIQLPKADELPDRGR